MLTYADVSECLAELRKDKADAEASEQRQRQQVRAYCGTEKKKKNASRKKDERKLMPRRASSASGSRCVYMCLVLLRIYACLIYVSRAKVSYRNTAYICVSYYYFPHVSRKRRPTSAHIFFCNFFSQCQHYSLKKNYDCVISVTHTITFIYIYNIRRI